MNTQHLQYVVEIERMRSISQAAENLFIGQPNLSRILHDMEDTLGFKIFERTSRGVRPTERGTIFLQHAKSILREMDSIEALGPRRPVANRLRICIPRSAAMLDLTSEFIATLPEDQNLDVAIRECHARKALELLANGEVEIGIIRFRSEYRDYFEEQMTQRGLNFEILSKYRYQILLCRDHPLAQKKNASIMDCREYTMLTGLEHSVEDRLLRKTYGEQNITWKRVIRSDSIDTVMKMVKSGSGIAIGPQSFAEYYGVTAVPLVPARQDSLYFACLKSKKKEPEIREFQRYLTTLVSSVYPD